VSAVIGCGSSGSQSKVEAAASRALTQSLSPTTGVNATNVAAGSDNGTSCTGALWSCVDDGTSFAQNDGDHTYVVSTGAGGFHTAAYSGGPAGQLSQVVAHTVAAAQAGASGTATVSLYDGTTLVATGSAHTLTTTYAEVQDTFNVSVSSVANLRTRVTFSAANLKYTEIWVVVTTAGAHDAVLAGAGDIACNTGERNGTILCGSSRCTCADPATSSQVSAFAPDIVFTLGDNQYENASLSDFNANFDATWGQHSPIRPAPGNHEYNGNANTTACGGSQTFCSQNAYMNANYYAYFSSVKTQFDSAGNGWYSYDVATSDSTRPWHVVVLNAAICDHNEFSWADGSRCASGSAQLNWLSSDLAANAGKCILAYWHEPRFSISDHGGNDAYSPFWATLHAHGADVILQGHNHVYERYPQVAANGVLDSSGPVSFVVGTGGRDSGGCTLSSTAGPQPANPPTPAICVGHVFGALKLTLHPHSWDYDFESVAPTSPHVSDASSASIPCHN
jgi:hypothetical protein